MRTRTVVLVRVRMQEPTNVEWLRGELLNSTILSRPKFARQLWEFDTWPNARDNQCAASAREGLPALADLLHLRLPVPPVPPVAAGVATGFDLLGAHQPPCWPGRGLGPLAPLGRHPQSLVEA